MCSFKKLSTVRYLFMITCCSAHFIWTSALSCLMTGRRCFRMPSRGCCGSRHWDLLLWMLVSLDFLVNLWSFLAESWDSSCLSFTNKYPENIYRAFLSISRQVFHISNSGRRHIFPSLDLWQGYLLILWEVCNIPVPNQWLSEPVYRYLQRCSSGISSFSLYFWLWQDLSPSQLNYQGKLVTHCLTLMIIKLENVQFGLGALSSVTVPDDVFFKRVVVFPFLKFEC